ncbi:hypothetical protein CupriaWKF_28730 [Cupriavidus sp. WKF15]|uniref:hypothetical protein n=1 Tax=Cupriavidus sp. WKF15 TaxID=3032282 RepID=UPI0023E11EA3|nr:hypothetical protein [Cupriavidus sp. WKF15]WER48747.1 hypothetical protein CupriaWKF_28730 [Cupriavidus sp. WKF15]
MSLIESATASPPVPSSADTPAMAADAAADTPGSATARPGADVRISMPGSILGSGRAAKEAAAKDSEIDNSNLPDNVKKLVKRLRELREKLEQKVQELQELSNSTTGNPEQRRMCIEALRTEVDGLTAAMASVSADLAEATRKFSRDQKTLVASLIMG